MFLNQMGAGDFNNETLGSTALGSRTLASGMQGADVTEYQKLLIEYFKMKGENALPRFGADGDFGSETMNWTVKLRESLGLSPSGIMTASDIEKLKSSLGVSASADRQAKTTVISNSSKPTVKAYPSSGPSFVSKYGMYIVAASAVALVVRYAHAKKGKIK